MQSAVQKHVSDFYKKILYHQYFLKIGKKNLKKIFKKSFDIGYGWFWALNLSP